MKTKKSSLEEDEEEPERVQFHSLQSFLRPQLFLHPGKYLTELGPWNLWFYDLGGKIIVSEFKVLKIDEKKN